MKKFISFNVINNTKKLKQPHKIETASGTLKSKFIRILKQLKQTNA